MNQLSPTSQKPDVVQNRPQAMLVIKAADVCTALEQQLTRDYRVVSVATCDEALNHLAQGGCDLVLIDSDLETFRRIRACPPGATVPVIIITPAADKQEMLRALNAGVNDYMQWPLDADVLCARLRLLVVAKQTADAQRQMVARLKARGERKDRFLHIVTHDLKNPLNSIKLAHYILRTLLVDNAEAAEPLHTIETTVNSMNDLIMDFLESAALENGKVQLQPEAVVMEEAIWEVIFRYGATANAKNITLLMGETEGVVMADPRRLNQILTNLVSNAIKYSPHDCFVTISSTVQGKFVRLSVQDEGAGIPESERLMLFEPFSRTSSQPTGGESSTGLGLWIVKELVTLHGGRLGYEALAGGGSSFWVELPIPAVVAEEIAV